jgi:hypothetical protein
MVLYLEQVVNLKEVINTIQVVLIQIKGETIIVAEVEAVSLTFSLRINHIINLSVRYVKNEGMLHLIAIIDLIYATYESHHLSNHNNTLNKLNLNP